MLSPLLRQSSDVIAVGGQGAILFGEDGRHYLDFTAGIGVLSTGHSHPRVVAAAQEQVGTLVHGQYTTVRHRPLLDLSERLAELMPGDIDAFFFASAGTEAVEGALRLARQATGRPNVIVMDGGFHGRTMGALSMTTSKTALRSGLAPLMGGVHVTAFPTAHRYGWDEAEATRFALAELDHLLATRTAPDETAAIFVEPVLGEGGYIPAPDEFLTGLRERCDRHGMLLVVDEIQTGIGRTGRFWGHDHAGILPDLVISAKGLASGFPLSTFGARAELMAQGRPGSQGGTYGGNAVSCAAALATLDVVAEEGLVERAATLGERLLTGLRQATGDIDAVGDVRGRGLMVGIELRDRDGAPDGAAAGRVLKEAEQRDLLLLACGPQGQVVRLIPPLVVDEEQVDTAIAVVTEAIEKATA